MYRLRIERTFHATHALRLYDGAMEQPHAHDWRTLVEIDAEVLDDIEVVMDFHELETIVESATGPLDHISLNEHPAFSSVNPSAERVAEHLFKQIQPHLPSNVHLAGVTVTEAEGCRATYFEDGI
jgi:6-pyruvoyltetrahydropterin/6-carboxytetrahydropterin synthase